METEQLDEFTPAQQAALLEGYSGSGGILPDPRQNVHTFLDNVARTDDTSRLGYLTEEEVGTGILPSRSLKELSLFCKNVWKQKAWEDFFDAKAEILTSTSLSKNAKLLELAVVTKKEVAAVSKKPRKMNPGWFKKKKSAE